MSRILLARHGETAWNAAGRLQGHTDIALADSGRAQARALAQRLAGAGVTAVWTSDLARARETGEIVAASLGVAILVEPEVRERRFGVFEGLTREQCATEHPEAWRAWLVQSSPPPGGETKESVVARMTRALGRILDGATGTSLVVSHGAVMRLWMMHVVGATVPLIPNGATFAVERAGAAGFAVRAHPA
ncbi:MAG: histidine phosphatase family protein [Deltaproteobacteria bacterium]|nr:histidine phosphatase family protein [Deltaproteobacteria bacterium]MCW5806726.1 histidine phosphatase family protein [Deltaproteobacteria bacterium]